jgi:hypothetical protein
MEKNTGFKTMQSISTILNGNEAPLPKELTLSPDQLSSFKFAPLTSCDVERSFSMFKRMLSDNRQNLTPEHLEMMIVVQSYLRETST